LPQGRVTPVYIAAAYGHVDAIRLLQSLGADINTPAIVSDKHRTFFFLLLRLFVCVFVCLVVVFSFNMIEMTRKHVKVAPNSLFLSHTPEPSGRFDVLFKYFC
jgi:ankyrin repeat protein